MAKAGAFSSREQGLIGLGILASDGIEGELKENPETTFRLSPAQPRPFSIEVEASLVERAQEILQRHETTLNRFSPEPPEENPSAESSQNRVPFWPWLVVGAAILFLIAQREKRDPSSPNEPQPPHQQNQEQDRNGDGRPDADFHYDASGRATYARFDNNFDGLWDVIHDYGDAYHHESSTRDLDFDGFFEETAAYRHGVIESIEIREAENQPVLRRHEYENGVFSRESIDRDGDGEFEKVITYDPLGNAIEKAGPAASE